MSVNNDCSIPNCNEISLRYHVDIIKSESSLYKTDIDSLPNEIIQYIFTFITNNDVRSIELVSKRWRVLSLTFPMNEYVIDHIQNTNITTFESFVDTIEKNFPKDPISRRDYYLKLYNQNKDNYPFKIRLFAAFLNHVELDEISSESYYAKLFATMPCKEIATHICFINTLKKQYYCPIKTMKNLIRYIFLKEIEYATKFEHLSLDKAFNVLDKAIASFEHRNNIIHEVVYELLFDKSGNNLFELLFEKFEDHLIVEGILKNKKLVSVIINYLYWHKSTIHENSLKQILMYAKIFQKNTHNNTTLFEHLIHTVLEKMTKEDLNKYEEEVIAILMKCSNRFVIESNLISTFLNARMIKKISLFNSHLSLELIHKLPKKEIRSLLIDQTDPIKFLLFFPILNIYASPISILKEDFEFLSIISQKLCDLYNAEVNLNNVDFINEVTKFLSKLKDIDIVLSHNHNGVVFAHNLMEYLDNLKQKIERENALQF